MAGAARSRASARPLFPRRVHPAFADRSAGASESATDLRHPVSHRRANLLETAADPRLLGASIGFLAVLHTWGQNLHMHPHLHCVVPGGGISLDGSRWI